MAHHDHQLSWFLVQLKPNSASIADRNLQRQGFKTFIPTEEVTTQRQGRFVTTQQPLFSGYIFVNFDPEGGFWRSINSTYGVSRLVSFGCQPKPVPTELVRSLMSRCDADGKLLPPKIFKPGETVVFSTGPFAKFVAKVEKINPDKRVWVLLELLGGLTRVSANADQLKIV